MSRTATIEATRATRAALAQTIRDGVRWMNGAPDQMRRHFNAPNLAAEYEDRAAVMEDVLMREEGAVQQLPNAREGLLTTKEAAEYVGMSHKTLEKYRETGTGPAFMRDGDGYRARVLYRPDDLDAFLASRRHRVAVAAE